MKTSIGTRRRGTDRAAMDLLEPGDYMHLVDDSRDYWVVGLPERNGVGDVVIGNLAGHRVIEHEDGTITVSPSILCSQGHNGFTWHGYLEHGRWRTV